MRSRSRGRERRGGLTPLLLLLLLLLVSFDSLSSVAGLRCYKCGDGGDGDEAQCQKEAGGDKECYHDKNVCVYMKHPDKEGSVTVRGCIASGEMGCNMGQLRNLGDGWVCYCNTDRRNAGSGNEESSGLEHRPQTTMVLLTSAVVPILFFREFDLLRLLPSS